MSNIHYTVRKVLPRRAFVVHAGVADKFRRNAHKIEGVPRSVGVLLHVAGHYYKRIEDKNKERCEGQERCEAIARTKKQGK